MKKCPEIRRSDIFNISKNRKINTCVDVIHESKNDNRQQVIPNLSGIG